MWQRYNESRCFSTKMPARYGATPSSSSLPFVVVSCGGTLLCMLGIPMMSVIAGYERCEVGKSKTGTKMPAAARCRLLDRRSTMGKKRKEFPPNRPASSCRGKTVDRMGNKHKSMYEFIFFMHRLSVRLPASRTSIILWMLFLSTFSTTFIVTWDDKF